jgi:hypothetical protein
MRRALAGSLAALAAGACLCCAGSGAVPDAGGLALDVRFAPLVPDDADLAAADLAVASLGADRAAAGEALSRIERADAEREQEGETATGLAPVGQDLANAAEQPGRAYLDASEALLERRDLDAATRERIERRAESDPLAVADARIYDARMNSFARGFNAVAEPLGRSVATTALLPVRLGMSLARYAIGLYREDPLPLQRRQALAEWKNFLARYPEAPESEAVAKKAAKAEARWQRMQKERALDAAERALGDGNPRLAREQSERALRIAPEDRKARRLCDRAREQIAEQRAAAARSTGFELAPGAPLVPEGSRRLVLALLDPAGDVESAAAAIPEDSPVRDEARFAVARVRREAKQEDETLALLSKLAKGDSTMARHAQAILADPLRSPWPHFEAARTRDRLASTRFVLTGPARGPEWTPDGVALWILNLPGLLSTVVTMPIRLIELPFLPPPPTARRTAVQAERYLALHPDGIHAETVREWLEDYERGRGNHVAALRVAEQRTPPPKDLSSEREDAAAQVLEVARAETRLDLRAALLDGIVQRYAETEAGREAKGLLLEEIAEATPQRIALSRRFLIENPEVAGVRGLALDPALLDEDVRNGELHPEGVALIGGRRIELAFVPESGDQDDPAERRSLQVSGEHFARLVARLEETSFRNALLDADDPVVPDAQRDLVFERARLGLADRVDSRPHARSDFTYTGMRERYGLVRAREPWLPFDLVVSGSLSDLSLGAFPRWRESKKTPDAALYE